MTATDGKLIIGYGLSNLRDATKKGGRCLYEYACDWIKAGEELRCEDWKPEDMRMERDVNEQSKR